MLVERKTQYCHDVSSFQLDFRFNTIPIKIPARYFVNIDKLYLMFMGRSKTPRTVTQ